jgi:hypothetical protein
MFSNTIKNGIIMINTVVIERWMMLLVAGLILTGCAGTGPLVKDVAVINYEQVGACNGYRDGDALVSAGPNAAFVVFRIIDIDNTGSSKDFAFDPNLLSISSQNNMSSSLSLARLMGVFQAVPTAIPKGQQTGINGLTVTTVQTTTTNGAIDANKTSYQLSYQTAPNDPGVLFKSSSRTAWPLTEDCLSIKFPI